MKILAIFFGIIFFVFCFTYFLRNLYLLMAINKVRIPLYKDEKELFRNNMPLIIMKNQRRKIRIIILLFIIISYFFGYSFYIVVSSLFLAFLFSRISFNSMIWEQSFMEDYKEYLK